MYPGIFDGMAFRQGVQGARVAFILGVGGEAAKTGPRILVINCPSEVALPSVR